MTVASEIRWWRNRKQPKGVKPKMTERKLRGGCKLTRGVNAKRRKIKGRKTRVWRICTTVPPVSGLKGHASSLPNPSFKVVSFSLYI